MITPTVGRQVWYWRHHENEVFARDTQPEAATVVYVHNDRLVNLQVIDHNGAARPQLSIPLRQPEDYVAPEGSYCEWMPFQKGQAKRQEIDELPGARTVIPAPMTETADKID